jgi:hypothetical protein
MALGAAYVSNSEIKAHAEITDTDNDTELTAVGLTVSRLVERYCGRQFNDAGSATARVYEPSACGTYVKVDDFSTTTGLIVEHDSGLDGTYATTITSTNYTLEPHNGIIDGQTGHPYRFIRLHNGYTFTRSTNSRPTVQITAQWGWAAVPADVKQAVLLECARVFRRKYTPDGILAETTAGVAGYAVRVPTELDRTTKTILAPYRTHVLVA